MHRDKLAARLMVTFLAEFEEHLQSFNADLLALEREPCATDSAGPVESLLRTAHSLKGAARAVGVAPIEAACHHMEEILGGAKGGESPVDPALFSLLFRVVDAFAEAAARLRNKLDLADSSIEQLLPQLDAFAGGTPGPANPPGPTSLAEPLPTSAHDVPPPSPPPPRPGANSPPTPVTSSDTATTHVRVPAEKLDTLLSRSGELLVARRAADSLSAELAAVRASVMRWSEEWRKVGGATGRVEARTARAALAIGSVADRLRKLEKDLDRLVAGMMGDARRIDRAADNLDQEVRRLRMLPFGEACVGIDRAVRDLAVQCGKRVELVVEGSAVQLDRSVLQGLKDPLLHLVRNAVDHAIETPDRRLAAGKPATGRIVVGAELRGGQVEVVVADDGGGLDLDALRLRAHRYGLPEPADEDATIQLIFRPGFSTAAAVTNVSGRGVGLDVVRDRVEALHGTIEVTSDPGSGTRFTLRLPLTLTTLRAVLVEAGGQVFAIAGTNVRRLVRVGPENVKSIRGRSVASLDGVLWPVTSLAAILGMPELAETAASPKHRQAVLMAAGERRAAIVVDAMLSEQEVMVKRLGPRIGRVPHVAGATILPSGQIALVLHAADLIRTALAGPATLLSGASSAEASRRRQVLVVDDSVTTRTLEQAILESAGYEVLTAADGEAGWHSLNEHGADLLVSDVDMPRLDGFGLTATVRASEKFRDLPIVLVTARGTEADRVRGMEAGADAYLIKSAFNQSELLATVASLL